MGYLATSTARSLVVRTAEFLNHQPSERPLSADAVRQALGDILGALDYVILSLEQDERERRELAHPAAARGPVGRGR